jgi:hypothetical protein
MAGEVLESVSFRDAARLTVRHCGVAVSVSSQRLAELCLELSN